MGNGTEHTYGQLYISVSPVEIHIPFDAFEHFLWTYREMNEQGSLQILNQYFFNMPIFHLSLSKFLKISTN
jgi:hypothetical protein